MADDKKWEQKSREGLVSFMIWIEPELRKAIKQAALDEDVTVQDLAKQMLIDGVAHASKFAKKVKR